MSARLYVERTGALPACDFRRHFPFRQLLAGESERSGFHMDAHIVRPFDKKERRKPMSCGYRQFERRSCNSDHFRCLQKHPFQVLQSKFGDLHRNSISAHSIGVMKVSTTSRQEYDTSNSVSTFRFQTVQCGAEHRRRPMNHREKDCSQYRKLTSSACFASR